VVGVVGDVHDTALDVPAEPVIYKPMLDAADGRGLTVNVRAMTVTVRTTQNPLSLVPQVRSLVESLDPDLPLADVQPLASLVGRSHGRMSFTVVILALGAAAALVLGAVGIYGVIAYGVSQRTGEIGLRQALGADRGRVLGLVLGEGLRVAAVGIVLGISAAVGLGRTLSSLLYGISPYDLATLGGSSVVFLLVAALASAIPAARAARIPPAVALRGE
jgi:ABC-type antimicrobial peptide transport system permease subunit